MPLKKYFKSCSICRLKAYRKGSTRRTFLSKFPLDPERCKKWVQVTGDEDLVYVPIEKLHSLKYVCENHFKGTDFNRKGTRLRKHAVPSLNLKKPMLPDELFVDFPCHVASNNEILSVTEAFTIENDHSYFTKIEETKNLKLCEAVTRTDALNDDLITDRFNDNEKKLKPNSESENTVTLAPPGLFSWNKDYEVLPNIDRDSELESKQTEEARDSYMDEEFLEESIADSEDDIVNDIKTKETLDIVQEEHEGFECNLCSSSIIGFRYTCVQCQDFDMCGACEALRLHQLHYVLRVPGPRPYREVQTILESLRSHLFQNHILLKPVESEQETSIKEETNEEDPFESVQVLSETEQSEDLGQFTEVLTSSKQITSTDHPILKKKIDDEDKSKESIQPDKKIPRVVLSRLPIYVERKATKPKDADLKEDIRRAGDKVLIFTKKLEKIKQKSIDSTQERMFHRKNITKHRTKIRLSLSKVPLNATTQSKTTDDRVIESNLTEKPEVGDGVVLVTPEYLGLNKNEIEKLFHSETKGTSSRHVLIQIDNPKDHARLLQLRKQNSVQVASR